MRRHKQCSHGRQGQLGGSGACSVQSSRVEPVRPGAATGRQAPYHGSTDCPGQVSGLRSDGSVGVRGTHRLRTCLPSLASLYWKRRGDRAGGSLDQAYDDRLRRDAGCHRRDRLVLAHAPAGGVARAAGLGGDADASIGGRDDYRGINDLAGRLAQRQPRRFPPVDPARYRVGSAASLAANVAVAEPTATGRIIAAWPSFSLIAPVPVGIEASQRGRSGWLRDRAAGWHERDNLAVPGSWDELIDNFGRRPGMFVGRARHALVRSFVEGFGADDDVLHGFQQWLSSQPQHRAINNFAWPSLLLHEVFPERDRVIKPSW
jgi:hypothetical protein